jgi:hypothetical protein
VFTTCVIESRTDNEIYLELSVNVLSRALASVDDSMVSTLKLISRAGVAYLSLTVQVGEGVPPPSLWRVCATRCLCTCGCRAWCMAAACRIHGCSSRAGHSCDDSVGRGHGTVQGAEHRAARGASVALQWVCTPSRATLIPPSFSCSKLIP